MVCVCLLDYSAGACLPLHGPFGCFMQLEEVSADSEEKLWPQYLQVYLLFSLPSYNLCLPLHGPAGCFMQLDDVNEDTDENFCPQYSQ